MKKNNKIIINCTTDQKEKIQRQADKLGFTLSEFMLKLGLSTEVNISIQRAEKFK